jgi:sulfur-oxidizing protein SoxY
MNYVRRDVLRAIAGASASVIGGLAAAETASPISSAARIPNELLTGAQESDEIVLEVAVFAESGGHVPVTVTANLTDVESISIIVERNAQPLAATLEISPFVAPYFQTQVRIEKSSNVVALIRQRNSQKLLFASVDVLVSSTDGCP